MITSSNNVDATTLAPLRVAVVLIPDQPLFQAVINASQAITKLFRNQKIIDSETFPPHASLHICTISGGRLKDFAELLRSTFNASLPVLRPTRLRMGSSGYVTLDLDITPQIRELHESTIEAAATIRGIGYVDDRRTPQWYSAEDRANYDRYGNIYVGKKFDFHLSIAKVEAQYHEDAYQIAERELASLGEVKASKFQICDIGMRSEKWVVLENL